MSHKTKTVIEYIEREEIVAIKCDLCDNHEIVDDNDGVYVGNYFATFEFQVGYGSPYDGNVYTLDVCHECLNKYGKQQILGIN